MKDINYDVMLYRRNELEKNLDEIRATISGRTCQFRDYIETDGKIDAKKTERFIQDIIKAYQEFLDNDEKFENDKTCVTKGKLKKLLHHYLYITIVGPKNEYEYTLNTFLPYCFFNNKNKYFDDLLSLSNELITYKNLKDLYFDEQYYIKEESGYEAGSYIDYLNNLFQSVTEKTILETYKLPKEIWDENNIIKLNNEDTVASENDVYNENSDRDIFKDNILAPLADEESEELPLDNEDVIELPEPSPEYYEEQEKILLAEFAEVQETESETLEEWKASVPDPIKFCDIYIEFRNLFFDNALSSFTKNWKDNVTNMIDAFLYKEGLSLYSLGDDYGMIAKHIHITAKKINIIRHKKEQ
ncbi:hypothetical protein SAMN02910369_02811 [Lachnospiraceae bacterium NE2001]|nr:hypothetical protein SAMN02910369_02811 [Lachnospiraceae bacterium NE2001]